MIKLFDITDRDFSSNGDAVLQPYKAIVHKEDNGEYYLELETDLKWADILTANRIIAVDMPAGQQAFRIINPIQTGTKITLRANHVFYDSENYLIADSFAESKTCEQALNQFNNALEPSSSFTVSSDITTIESYRPVRESFRTVIETMIERWGGHLVRNNWDIQINESISFDTGITIRYAKNLESIQVEEKWDNVVTKILPVGQDGILLNSVTPSASIYIEGDIDKYPIPFTKAVTFDQNFNSEDYSTETAYKNAVIADLRKQAEEYLIKHAVPEVSYTVKAHLNDVYDIGNTIEVIDERLGLNLTTQVTSFDYDCISERFIEIVFGNFKPKLNKLLNTITGTKKFNNVSFSTITNNLNNNSIRIDNLTPETGNTNGWSWIKYPDGRYEANRIWNIGTYTINTVEGSTIRVGASVNLPTLPHLLTKGKIVPTYLGNSIGSPSWLEIANGTFRIAKVTSSNITLQNVTIALQVIDGHWK